MRLAQGHTIVCDGRYKDAKGDFVPCGVELHPGTQAIINKQGVLGHHCALCHDPEAAAALAVRLGISELKLRKMEPEEIEKARKVADFFDAAVADAAKKNLAIDGQIANLAPDADGKWIVAGQAFEKKSDAVGALEALRPAPVRKNGNGGKSWPS